MIAQRIKAIGFVGAAALTAALAVVMVPNTGVAAMTESVPLETLFPSSFGNWRIDPDVIPIEPAADLRKVLAESYDQTLSRTYVNSRGYRVMLSVAYGGRRNQGMDIHRPEVCYPAQGMAVRRDTIVQTVDFDHHPLTLRRLVAGSGNRNEPISYWLVIGREVASFGYGHRIALLKYGLTGHVPDGMLVRVSSIDGDEPGAFQEQDAFLHDMLAALSPDFRRRILGEN